MRGEKWVDRLAFAGFILTMIDIVLSAVAGLIAALIGGQVTEWGSGMGGGYAIPPLANTLALLLTLPALILGIMLLIRKREGAVGRIWVFVGTFLIGFGYILIAHSFDPCIRGVWTSHSRLGDDIRLCERFGNELNIHTRFHLIWHAVPTIPLLLIYWYGLARTYPQLLSVWRR